MISYIQMVFVGSVMQYNDQTIIIVDHGVYKKTDNCDPNVM